MKINTTRVVLNVGYDEANALINIFYIADHVHGSKMGIYRSLEVINKFGRYFSLDTSINDFV